MKSLISREVSTVAVEGLVLPIIITEWSASPAKATHTKKKESAEDCKAKKAAKATAKQAS